MNREAERKRLTTDKKKIFVRECPTIMSVTKAELHKLYIEIFDRLQEYEVAEETGQIIVPPVKVGQTLYLVRQDIQKIIEVVVTAIMQRKTFQYAEVDIVEDNRKSFITLAYWGNRLFPTREEAQKALEGSGEK